MFARLLRGRSTPAMRAIVLLCYPCRCLCFELTQITRTTPLRWMTLHLSQIFFTDALTFIQFSVPGSQFSASPKPAAELSPSDHLYRYTILPRFRSYGESSTATLSPGKMRMKFLRIFPETCASTWCLFSSSTRNMALGRGSRTTAITSIASSLLIDSLGAVSYQSSAIRKELQAERQS